MLITKCYQMSIPIFYCQAQPKPQLKPSEAELSLILHFSSSPTHILTHMEVYFSAAAQIYMKIEFSRQHKLALSVLTS